MNESTHQALKEFRDEVLIMLKESRESSNMFEGVIGVDRRLIFLEGCIHLGMELDAQEVEV